jgi:hypothetical protein
MSLLRRIEPFLYSRRNLAGVLLALGGLAVLYFLGIGGGLLWIPAIVALYAVGVLLVRPRRSVKLDLQPVPQDTGQIRDALQRLLIDIHGRVADDVYERVRSIRDSILGTLSPAGAAADTTDPNVFLVRQTALNYLPQALHAYLAVPRAYAEHNTVAGGKTPHDALIEQLDLMDAKLHEVAEAVVRHDSDRLLVNTRFLAERFGGSTLTVGSTAPATTAQEAEQSERARVR